MIRSVNGDSNGAAAGMVLFAENQVKGRGRREKSWVAAAGRDLLFSVLVATAYRTFALVTPHYACRSGRLQGNR
jgi:biotin-(acetyl-CoA carboxylase) ligase